MAHVPGETGHRRPLGTVQAINDFILAAAGQPWVLFLVLACCLIDGFFPPIPSESVVVGRPPSRDCGRPQPVAAAARGSAAGAFTGDNIAYLIGRGWVPAAGRRMRGPANAARLPLGRRELRKRPASLILVARFVPSAGWQST